MKKAAMFILLGLLVIAGALVCVFFIFPSAQTSATEYWPEGEWRTSMPERQSMDSGLIANMINDIQESGMDINSVTVIRNGYLVSETYFYPYQKGYKHALYSCTKSVTSALVGAAIQDGVIKSADDNVLGYFSDMNIANADTRKRDVTIRDLLTMTSGLDWKFENDVSSDEMLSSDNWTKYTLDLPMSEQPGKTFNYSDGAAHIASAIVQNAMGKTACEYFKERFAALGISDIYWETNPEGVTNGAAGLFMSPDDMAKLGYLYLKKGNWNGEQIIPQSWVEESTKPYAQPDWTPLLNGYGYFWWMPRFGGYAAVGNGGNFIFVVPEKNLVVVFTSGIYDNSVIFYPCELMEQYIIPAVKSDAPLPGNDEATRALCEAVSAVQDDPVPAPVSLPDTALRVSGKTYDVNGSPVVFDFKEGKDEFTFEIASVKYTAGLDGVYRIYDAGAEGSLPDHNHVAARGRWLSSDTLQIEIRGLEDAYVNVYTVRFEGDNITAEIESNLWPSQTVTGSIVG